MPQSSERDESELALRVLLGTAWLALKGWPAPEVWTSLHPALALAKSLGRNDALVPILWGLSVNVRAQGHVAESIHGLQEMLDIRKGDWRCGTADHWTRVRLQLLFWMGRLVESLEHDDKVLALYDRKALPPCGET